MSILLSGGASGADTIFSTCAKAMGHETFAFSFLGHNGGEGKYDLTVGQLEANAELLGKVAKNLKKRFSVEVPPQPQLAFIRNLLLRNAYQIHGLPETGPTEVVYAVTRLTKDRKHIRGGTGWAIEIAASLSHDPTIYIFDMSTNKWHTLVEDTFEPCGNPPVPNGTYTGIGARDLTDGGIEAIGQLYGLE